MEKYDSRANFKELRKFLRGLRERNQKDLVGILKILREHNLDAVARGSTAVKGHDKNYRDIDLLVRGDPNRFDEAVRHIEIYKYQPYTPAMGPYVDEPGIKTRLRFSDFDISYHPDKKLRDDVPQVDLLINPDFRE